MCGRYTLKATPTDLAEQFGLPAVPDMSPRFNIAPTQDVPVIRFDDGRVLDAMRWGLVPSG